MEEVAELVEEGADLAVGEQGGTGGGGRGEVAADEGEVGAEAAGGGGTSGDKAVHPRALPLGLPGEPVRVEGAEVEPGFVAHLEVADIGVPDGGVVHAPHREAEEAPRDLEEPGLDLFQREPGPQHFVVHVEALPAQLLHQPGRVPGPEGAEARAARVALEFAGVALVEGARSVDELVEEGADVGARAGHQRFEAVVGEVRIAEQGGNLAPHFENPPDEGPVVAFARRAAVQIGSVDLVTQGTVVGVLQDRLHARHVEGDQPALLVPVGREPGRALEGGLREAGKGVRIGDHLAVGGGLLQEMLLEPAAEFGEFEAEVFQSLLAGRVQRRARAAEVAERAVEVAAADPRERRARGRVRETAQPCEEPFVMMEPAREPGDVGERGRVGLAQIRGWRPRCAGARRATRCARPPR